MGCCYITNTTNVKVHWNQVRDKGWKNFELDDRKSLDCLEQNAARNINVKGASGEISDGNEGHLIEHCRTGNTCYKVAENSSKFCSIVGWEGELVCDDLEDKIKDILH